ncbi:MAG: hypothetical protein R3E39_11815 [Anaerolineae bacterium]
MKRHIYLFVVGVLSVFVLFVLFPHLAAQDKLTSEVFGAIWNQDESQILSWSVDGTLRIWDGTTGKLVYTLQHDAAVNGAVWSNDYSRILSWSADNTARVWEPATGELLLTLQHDDVVNGAAWSNDYSRILTWSEDNAARVWEATTGKLMFTLQHDAAVQEARWNKDDGRILSRSNSGVYECIDQHRCLNKIWIWDAASGANLLTIDSLQDFVGGVIWNSDETKLLSWVADGWINVWDARTGDRLLNMRSVGALTAPSGTLMRLAFSRGVVQGSSVRRTVLMPFWF